MSAGLHQEDSAFSEIEILTGYMYQINAKNKELISVHVHINKADRKLNSGEGEFFKKSKGHILKEDAGGGKPKVALGLDHFGGLFCGSFCQLFGPAGLRGGAAGDD
jgi:hypothetical protein